MPIWLTMFTLLAGIAAAVSLILLLVLRLLASQIPELEP